MALKNNIRSIRFSDELMEIINQQIGDSFNARFERLVYNCYMLLPERERQAQLLQDRIDQQKKELAQLSSRYYTAVDLMRSMEYKLSDMQKMLELAEKWFAPLADHPSATAAIPQEPMQTQARRQEVERDVPASTVTVAYHMCARTKPDFYTADLVSDLLSGGDSGRLYTHLVKERNLLSSVNAYITGDVDPGLFVFTGQLLPGVTPEAAEAAFREEIEALQTTVATAYEIEKVKNKFEANTLFGELNVMNKAMNLGFYEMLGDLSLINREVDRYRAVTDEDIRSFSRRTLRPENSSTLIYNARK